MPETRSGLAKPAAGFAAAFVLLIGLAISLAPVAAASGTRPAIVTVSSSPLIIPARGGYVRIAAQVRHARRCLFAAQRVAQGAISPIGTADCRPGRASARVWVTANRYQHQAAIHFRVRALDAAGRSVQRTGTIVQAAASAPPPSSAPSPPGNAGLQISNVTLPGGSVGDAYSATFVASGGTAPYSWSIVGGALPPGLTLTAAGTVSGTPTTVGQSNFTIQVVDSSARPQQASAAVSITVTPAVTPPPPAPSVATDTSTNWSGYVLDGGPFTSVRGTFTVPTLFTSPASGSVAEWVGLDGDSSSNPSVLQAGVAEDYDVGSNRYLVHAWWESYPAPPHDVPVVVNSGDRVTVKIAETGAALWTLTLADDTTGRSYTTVQTYTGPATSAEWIVEAPTDMRTNKVVPLPSYSDVTFTNLGVVGSEGPLTRVVMIANGVPISEPSPLTSAGFTVAHGSVVPAAPPG